MTASSAPAQHPVSAIRSVETLSAGSFATITETCVLRAFERRRRNLCGRLIRSGAHLSLGFDDLELSAALDAAERLHVEAVLLIDEGARLCLEFRATFDDEHQIVQDPGMRTHAPRPAQVLGRAVGWTLVPGQQIPSAETRGRSAATAGEPRG